MNKKRYILALSALLITIVMVAQQNYIQEIDFKDVKADKTGQTLYISATIDLSNLHLGKNHQIQLTPTLVSKDGTLRKRLPYLLIQGKTKNKVYLRKKKYNNRTEVEKNAQQIVCRKNNTVQTLPYSVNMPLQKAMNNASLQLYYSISGCGTCNMFENNLILIDKIKLEEYVPTYMLTYIVPEVEPVKTRSAKYAAYFNYKVGRHELLRNYKNNAYEFERVDRVLHEIRNDKNLTITDFTVTGYASPEGLYSSNMSLSQRRANSFADYLVQAHHIPRNIFRVTWKGEDWQGLKDAVRKSYIMDKQAILNIIETVTNPDARDAQLKKLSGGTTYKRLVNDFYPPLRRNEYTITFIARAFDVEEAKVIIKTKPQLLSLNEMYLVAQTYPADSKQFKEVFDIAVRMFPNEPIATVNSAAADIEGGNNGAAIERLLPIVDNPRVWNNLGVAYARMGDIKNAMKYFSKAVNQGDPDAIKNMEELKIYMENADIEYKR